MAGAGAGVGGRGTRLREAALLAIEQPQPGESPAGAVAMRVFRLQPRRPASQPDEVSPELQGFTSGSAGSKVAHPVMYSVPEVLLSASLLPTQTV